MHKVDNRKNLKKKLIFFFRNFEQLKLVFQEYQTLTGSTFERDIEKEFSGDIKNALLAVVKIIKNPIAYYAERLHKSMVGLGTNDKSLIRVRN